MFESYLELFTVLFLKSDEVIKTVLVADLLDMVETLIKE
jgi:hypothetical protein